MTMAKTSRICRLQLALSHLEPSLSTKVYGPSTLCCYRDGCLFCTFIFDAMFELGLLPCGAFTAIAGTSDELEAESSLLGFGIVVL
jgi:hypothetical protein